ncbi:MAG: hypothetical protein DWI03_00520 [Planctomycetota bacterium]|nr:MAG: hypothetical protein DWI03_00520 [Planctomycetota bacterium]
MTIPGAEEPAARVSTSLACRDRPHHVARTFAAAFLTCAHSALAALRHPMAALAIEAGSMARATPARMCRGRPCSPYFTRSLNTLRTLSTFGATIAWQ